MYIPKRYGQSKIDTCPFCEKQAITQNSQKVPVCLSHAKTDLPPMKCMCGETLDVLHGKYGVFFSCMKHGNINLRKALEINPISHKYTSALSMSSSTPSRKTNTDIEKNSERKKEDKQERKETVVTRDELDWMF